MLGSSCSGSVQDLLRILMEASGGRYQTPHESYNEVYPNVFIGDEQLGITHVLNTAQGPQAFLASGTVNTNATFYREVGITFKGIPAADFPGFKISRYFDECADFIQDCLNAGGKILVHCQQGISRSATIVLAYLMIKKGYDVKDSIRMIRKERAIFPNEGFLCQLLELNGKLQRRNYLSRMELHN